MLLNFSTSLQGLQSLKAGQADRILLQKDLEVARNKLTAAVVSRDMYKTVSNFHASSNGTAVFCSRRNYCACGLIFFCSFLQKLDLVEKLLALNVAGKKSEACAKESEAQEAQRRSV